MLPAILPPRKKTEMRRPTKIDASIRNSTEVGRGRGGCSLQHPIKQVPAGEVRPRQVAKGVLDRGDSPAGAKMFLRTNVNVHCFQNVADLGERKEVIACRAGVCENVERVMEE